MRAALFRSRERSPWPRVELEAHGAALPPLQMSVEQTAALCGLLRGRETPAFIRKTHAVPDLCLNNSLSTGSNVTNRL